LSYVFDHVPAPEEAADDVEDPRAEAPHQQFESVVVTLESSANQLILIEFACAPGNYLLKRFNLSNGAIPGRASFTVAFSLGRLSPAGVGFAAEAQPNRGAGRIVFASLTGLSLALVFALQALSVPLLS
jgi:hypothetical protein